MSFKQSVAALTCTLAVLPIHATAATAAAQKPSARTATTCKTTTRAARTAAIRSAGNTVRTTSRTTKKATKRHVRTKRTKRSQTARKVSAATKAVTLRCVTASGWSTAPVTQPAPIATAPAPTAGVTAPSNATPPSTILTAPVATAPVATAPVATAPVAGATATPSAPAPAAPAAPATTPLVGDASLLLGIHAGAHWYAAWEDPTEYLDRVATTGVKALREDFRFDLVEKSQGVFDWTRYDRLYTATAQRGMTVLPILDAVPAWADGSPYPAPANYARYVAIAVKRYGPDGTFWAAHPELPKAGASQTWELWNEPYEPYYSGGAPDPAAYAKMVTAAVDAGRAANPAAKYLLSATYKTYGGRSWVDGMYAAQPDLNSRFDGVAVHAYGNDLDDAGGQFRRTMEDVRASFVSHGASDKPFHVTETGWSTCTATTSPDCVTEARQATLLTGVVERLRTTYKSYVRSAYIFGYHDPDKAVLDPNNSQDHYGVAHTNGSPKPAMLALKALMGV